MFIPQLCAKTAAPVFGLACVAAIGDCAFDGCSNLTGVAIPNSVTSVGEFAFKCCEGLSAVAIPASATSVGAMVRQF